MILKSRAGRPVYYFETGLKFEPVFLNRFELLNRFGEPVRFVACLKNRLSNSNRFEKRFFINRFKNIFFYLNIYKIVIFIHYNLYIQNPKSEYNKNINIVDWWWNRKQVAYPILSKITRYYLTIMPPSVPSERTFSGGGSNIIPNRSTFTSYKMFEINKIFLKRFKTGF